MCHADLSRSRESSAIITENKLGSGHHENYFPIFGLFEELGRVVGDNGAKKQKENLWMSERPSR